MSKINRNIILSHVESFELIEQQENVNPRIKFYMNSGRIFIEEYENNEEAIKINSRLKEFCIKNGLLLLEPKK